MNTINGKVIRIPTELWERLKKDGAFGEPVWRALERVFEREDTTKVLLTQALSKLKRLEGDSEFSLFAENEMEARW